MITARKYLKSKPVCKVTFRIAAEEAPAAEKAVLLGDFNEWSRSAQPMRRLKNGDFTQTVDLPRDSAFQYRILLDDQNWINDPQADGYERSPLGHFDNSVVRV